MRPPRKCRRSSPSNLDKGRPWMRTSPRTMETPGGKRPSNERARIDLPAAVSPTTPRISFALSVHETPSRIGVARPSADTVTSSSSRMLRPSGSDSMTAPLKARVRKIPDCVRKQRERQNRKNDRESRKERDPPNTEDHLLRAVADHEPPFRQWHAHAGADERQPGCQKNRHADGDRNLHDHRR